MKNISNNITDLYFSPKRISLIALAATAVICSKVLFFFFDDAEGPNLLIVAGLAAVVYLLSLVAFIFGPFKNDGIKRLSAVIAIQLLFVTGLYFCLK